MKIRYYFSLTIVNLYIYIIGNYVNQVFFSYDYRFDSHITLFISLFFLIFISLYLLVLFLLGKNLKEELKLLVVNGGKYMALAFILGFIFAFFGTRYH